MACWVPLPGDVRNVACAHAGSSATNRQARMKMVHCKAVRVVVKDAGPLAPQPGKRTDWHGGSRHGACRKAMPHISMPIFTS